MFFLKTTHSFQGAGLHSALTCFSNRVFSRESVAGLERCPVELEQWGQEGGGRS